MPRNKLNRDDEVAIYFKDENSAPYMMHGKYISQNEEHVLIEGTVGEYIGKDYFIKHENIKMIERIKRAKPEGSY
jgi:hypothetical protein